VTDLADLEATDAGDGLVVARVRGDLDLSNLYSVHTALLEMLPNEAIGLVVDLGGVTFLDSSGVEALFRLQASLEVRQQRLAVAIPAGATIRRALELSGAPGEIPLCGSVDEALAALRAGPERGAQETG
jgi:anti-anti-sigma factor